MGNIKLSSNSAILVFDLNDPDAREDYLVVHKAKDFLVALRDIDGKLRNLMKYGEEKISPKTLKTLEEIRGLIWEEIEEL